jgi:hypothetical protein
MARMWELRVVLAAVLGATAAAAGVTLIAYEIGALLSRPAGVGAALTSAGVWMLAFAFAANKYSITEELAT